MNCLDELSAEDWELIKSLIDVNSFADAYIVQELFGNFDVGNLSFYMYKPKGVSRSEDIKTRFFMMRVSTLPKMLPLNK